MAKKRSRKRKPSKRPDSRIVIAGEPFAAIAGLFGKSGSSRRNKVARGTKRTGRAS